MAEDIEGEQLIIHIQERPVLWDRTARNYKNKSIKSAAWKEVCKNVLPGYNEFTNQEKTKCVHEVMKKWTSIKDNYFRYVKKLNEMNKTGTVTKKFKEYHLYKQLQFLKKNETDERKIKEKKGLYQSLKKQYFSRGSSYIQTQPPLKKKIIDVPEEEISSKLAEPENRHISFFKATLPSLNKLNDHQTLIFQSRVLQILTDLSEPSHQFCYPHTDYQPFQGSPQPSTWLIAQTVGPSTPSIQDTKPLPTAKFTLDNHDER